MRDWWFVSLHLALCLIFVFPRTLWLLGSNGCTVLCRLWEGQNDHVQFAEIFAKMVFPLLHDFELFILLCAFCEFKIFCMINSWFVDLLRVAWNHRWQILLTELTLQEMVAYRIIFNTMCVFLKFCFYFWIEQHFVCYQFVALETSSFIIRDIGELWRNSNSFTSVVRIGFTDLLLVWLCACQGCMMF
jgi:hypothetical protein